MKATHPDHHGIISSLLTKSTEKDYFLFSALNPADVQKFPSMLKQLRL